MSSAARPIASQFPPGAEMHFHQAGRDSWRGVQGLNEPAATLCRAGDHRQIRWQLRTQGSRRRFDVGDQQVELYSRCRCDQRSRVADQENLHSRPK